jgi:ferredoxin
MMSSEMIISKEGVKSAFTKMLAEYRLAAPASNGKVVDFLEISDVNDVVMDDRIAYKSPKEFYFPRNEKLMSFGDDEAMASKPEKTTIVFGVKPCDLEALDTMTKIFTEGKYEDPFFAAHVANTLVIGVGCLEKKSGCFCERLPVNKEYSDKCDMFLEDSGDNYKVLYVSDRGKETLVKFFPDLKDFVNPAPKEKTTVDPLALPTDATLKAFEKVDWEPYTETCQGCGLCTFICPTCHCFGFRDVEEDGVACRYRNWDSCMFAKFTLHASGHNPRETKVERYRQRVLHKYVYVPQNVGQIACTGCGRCLRSCPAGVSIHNIVQGIKEELK